VVVLLLLLLLPLLLLLLLRRRRRLHCVGAVHSPAPDRLQRHAAALPKQVQQLLPLLRLC
jgi:hypothetical protein